MKQRLVGGWEGVVTDMGIRTAKITNDNGEVRILSNSRISDVVNKSRKEAAEQAPASVSGYFFKRNQTKHALKL